MNPYDLRGRGIHKVRGKRFSESLDRRIAFISIHSTLDNCFHLCRFWTNTRDTLIQFDLILISQYFHVMQLFYSLQSSNQSAILNLSFQFWFQSSFFSRKHKLCYAYNSLTNIFLLGNLKKSFIFSKFVSFYFKNFRNIFSLLQLRREVRRLTTMMNSPINPHTIITTLQKDPQ